MATYALGDVHGCAATLEALLARIRFDPAADRLLLVGDLVNRGPGSLEVLRWARGLGDHRAVAVLGNHELHLLARAWGLVGAKRRDTLDEILAAPDAGELIDWVRRWPLFHRERLDGGGEAVLVHAGLFPAWTLERADELAREVSRELAGEGARDLVAGLGKGREEEPPWPPWEEELPPAERRILALAAFTRLRTLDPRGAPCNGYGGPPQEAPAGCRPWFAAWPAAPGRRPPGATLIFGHWAALGLHLAPGLAALDSGCVWGGHLTALRLDDGAVFQERSRDPVPGPRR